MNFTETLKVALTSIWPHKLRSFLTLLGMIVGVAAFMLILSGLLGFNAYIDEKLLGAGTNSFTIQRFDFSDYQSKETFEAAQRRNKHLTFEELGFLRSRKDLIAHIGAKAGGTSVEVKRGTKKLLNVRVSASDPIISLIDNVEIAEGRYFVDSENDAATRVAYIGKDIANELFPRSSPLNQKIHIRGMPYRVVGVQMARGTIFGMSQDNFIVLPTKTYSSQFGSGSVRTSLAFVGVPHPDKALKPAIEEARTLMRVKRKVAFSEKDNFGIFSPQAMVKLRQEGSATMFIIVLTVPAISLFVGAIVIMNTMLVSVTDRTKEIGLRKTVGASRSSIVKQFLIESAVLTMLGGIFGLVIAEILGFIVSAYLVETIIPWWAAILSIGICGFVGVIAGLIPAWKAANLDPIEALQTD